MSTSPILEHELASELALPREVIRKMRRENLREGIDWFVAFKSIYLTPRAADVIRGYVSCAKDKNAPDEATVAQPDGITVVDDAALAAGPAAVRMLRVHKLVVNPHILLATDGAAVLRVRVQNTKNFRVGMEIPVKHIQADLFELARPCPRNPGKW